MQSKDQIKASHTHLLHNTLNQVYINKVIRLTLKLWSGDPTAGEDSLVEIEGLKARKPLQRRF